jgi:hypothetical protein
LIGLSKNINFQLEDANCVLKLKICYKIRINFDWNKQNINFQLEVTICDLKLERFYEIEKGIYNASTSFANANNFPSSHFAAIN